MLSGKALNSLNIVLNKSKDLILGKVAPYDLAVDAPFMETAVHFAGMHQQDKISEEDEDLVVSASPPLESI